MQSSINITKDSLCKNISICKRLFCHGKRNSRCVAATENPKIHVLLTSPYLSPSSFIASYFFSRISFPVRLFKFCTVSSSKSVPAEPTCSLKSQYLLTPCLVKKGVLGRVCASVL